MEVAMSRPVEQDVRSFIEENFLFRVDRPAVSDSESLIAAGLIDSTGILELVAHLEKHFGVTVEDGDIVPENLDSIEAIASYVRRTLASDAFERNEQTA